MASNPLPPAKAMANPVVAEAQVGVEVPAGREAWGPAVRVEKEANLARAAVSLAQAQAGDLVARAEANNAPNP